MSEQERLATRLFDSGAQNLHIFLGSRRVSVEELCAEINKALDEIERGEATEVRPSP